MTRAWGTTMNETITIVDDDRLQHSDGSGSPDREEPLQARSGARRTGFAPIRPENPILAESRSLIEARPEPWGGPTGSRNCHDGLGMHGQTGPVARPTP